MNRNQLPNKPIYSFSYKQYKSDFKTGLDSALATVSFNKEFETTTFNQPKTGPSFPISPTKPPANPSVITTIDLNLTKNKTLASNPNLTPSAPTIKSLTSVPLVSPSPSTSSSSSSSSSSASPLVSPSSQ